MKGKMITEKKFSDVKLLLHTGYSIKKAADIAELSLNTVKKIDKSANWQEYCGASSPTQEEKKKPEVINNDQIKILEQKIDATNILLEQIYELLRKYMEV